MTTDSEKQMEKHDPAVDKLCKFRIEVPYTLINRICIYRDNRGTLWYPDQWAKDLNFHAMYIKDLRLCCPVEKGAPPVRFVNSSTYPLLNRIQVYPLPPDNGWVSVAKNLVPNFLKIASVFKNSNIVHTEACGWPFPLSYYLLPLQSWQRRPWIFVLESTFWDLSPHEKPTLGRLFESRFNRFFVRKCLKQADVSIFTTASYKREFEPPGVNGIINTPTWIDLDQCLSTQDAEAKWTQKLRQSHAKYIFTGRMITQKGVAQLLEAIRILTERNVEISIDFMGSGGEFEEKIRELAAKPQGSVKTKHLEPVPYGPQFFATIAEYDAVLVPSLSQEQPRIPLDAASQALPIIGSDTIGLREIIENHKTGFLVAPGNAKLVADIIEKCSNNRAQLKRAGMEAIARARNSTHASMHLRRAQILSENLQRGVVTATN